MKNSFPKTSPIKNWLFNNQIWTGSVFLLYLAIICSCFLFIATSQAEAAVVGKTGTSTGALVGWWTFDEGTSTTAGDFSGRGNRGTLTNMANPPSASSGWTSLGKRGGALIFDGSDDYIDAGTGSSLDISNTLTLSAWVYQPNNTAAYRTIVTKRNGSGTNYQIYLQKTTGYFSYWNGGTEYSSGYIPPANVWTHLAVTISGTSIRFYANGVQVNSATLSGAPTPSVGSSLYIGRCTTSCDTGNEQFLGRIDDVRIYNQTLSAGDIMALYKSGETVRKVANNTNIAGYWPFDEGTSTSAGDMSGNGNTGVMYPGTGGTNTSTSSMWTAGKKGGAIRFDGTDDYIPAGNGATMNPTTALTVSAWVNYSDLSGRTIASKWGAVASSNYSWLLFTNWFGSGRVDFLTSSNGTGYVSANSGNGAVTTGRWYHIVGVFDGSITTSRLYINGVLVGTNTSAPSSLKISSTPVTIGADYDNGGAAFRFFNGKIDDVRIINRALSATEVQALYKQNQSLVGASQTTKYTNGLIGYWTFNGKDVTSSVAFDLSGRGYSGTLNGSPLPIIGKVGQAFRFNGSNSYISPGVDLGFRGDVAVSASAWFKPMGTNNGNFPAIVDFQSQGGTCTGLYFTVQANRPSIDFGTNRWRTTATLNQGEWYHIVVTKSPGLISATSKIYVNGTEAASAVENGDCTPNVSAPGAGGVVIGRLTHTSQYVNGDIDEVRIYNRTLSATEAKQLYLMGK